MGREIEAQGNYSIAIALNDQNGTVISQDNTMAIMGGKVGIDFATPTHLLDVGTMGAYCDGMAWVDGSSRDFKKGIAPLSETELQQLKTTLDSIDIVKFLYKQEEDGTPMRVGMIAEDMPDVLASKQRKGLDTGRHIGFLMAVVKAMNAENDKQTVVMQEWKAESDAKVAHLESEIARLRSLVEDN